MTSASQEFQIFVKPIGARRNLNCRYCYYLPKQNLYPQSESFRMPDDILEDYIAQHIAACPTPTILFAWHGGEPTLLGLDYFRKIVALQRKHQSPAHQIINGLQTNGTLLDEEWCRFLAAEDFFVGLSVDGPREFHDRYRATKGREPTHKRALQAFRLLKRYHVHCDTLCVVNDQNLHHPTAVYHFFKEIGVDFLQFLPLVERTNEGVSPETVPADAYGTFLCTILREWIRHDVGRIGIQIFDEAARPFLGMEHARCLFRETCGNFPVLEHNGDFFSCDHFVDQEHYIGNLRARSLVEMLDDPAPRAFGQRKRDALPRECRECDVLAMRNGGCPKDRFLTTRDGEPGLNYLCAGLKKFFTYSRPYMQRLAAVHLAGQTVDELMRQVRSEDAPTAPMIGRNDPCPCGSGKKHKKCCMGKASSPISNLQSPISNLQRPTPNQTSPSRAR